MSNIIFFAKVKRKYLRFKCIPSEIKQRGEVYRVHSQFKSKNTPGANIKKQINLAYCDASVDMTIACYMEFTSSIFLPTYHLSRRQS